jgi:NADP-dependent 3-hydroxy acid dehydrogenase YdfG
LALAREGCDVIAAARSGELLQELAAAGRDSKGRIVPCVGDLRDPAASPAPQHRRSRLSGAWIFW